MRKIPATQKTPLHFHFFLVLGCLVFVVWPWCVQGFQLGFRFPYMVIYVFVVTVFCMIIDPIIIAKEEGADHQSVLKEWRNEESTVFMLFSSLLFSINGNVSVGMAVFLPIYLVFVVTLLTFFSILNKSVYSYGFIDFFINVSTNYFTGFFEKHFYPGAFVFAVLCCLCFTLRNFFFEFVYLVICWRNKEATQDAILPLQQNPPHPPQHQRRQRSPSSQHTRTQSLSQGSGARQRKTMSQDSISTGYESCDST